MEFVWYCIIMGMLTIYFVFDGFDLGAGMVQLFFSKDENEKQIVYRAIGPFWDANEVWLIAGGGSLFCAFPLVYAASFSGFYLPLIIVLWLLIFRGISIELRGQIENTLWHTFWDKAFGIASFLLALFFGIALGNVIRGVNLGMVKEGVPTQEENFFFLPLWNDSFSPTDVYPGVIDWFTLIIGAISVVALLIHGSNWMLYKTKSTLNPRLKHAVYVLTLFLIVLVGVSIFFIQYIKPEIFDNFLEYPLLYVFPFICLIGLFGLLGVKKYKKDGQSFFFSILFIVGGLATSVVSIFPALLPSTNETNPSLDIYNASTNDYGLKVAIIWWSIAFVLAVIYFIIQYNIFKGKIEDLDMDYHH